MSKRNNNRLRKENPTTQSITILTKTQRYTQPQSPDLSLDTDPLTSLIQHGNEAKSHRDSTSINNITDKGPKEVRDFWKAYVDVHLKTLGAVLPVIIESDNKVGILAMAWKNNVYPVVEMFRETLKLSAKKRSRPAREVTQLMFGEFLSDTVDVFTQISESLDKPDNDNSLALAHCTEYIGDMHRYKWMYKLVDAGAREKYWQLSLDSYQKSYSANPHNGKLYHVISILYRPRSLLLSFYYDCRSLIANNPFDSSRESILTSLVSSENQLCKRLGIASVNSLTKDTKYSRLLKGASVSEAWQDAYLYIHKMLLTKIDLDNLDRWLDYVYLPLLAQVTDTSSSSLKFGTRVAISDLTSLHQFGRKSDHNETSAPVEILASAKVISRTIGKCAAIITKDNALIFEIGAFIVPYIFVVFSFILSPRSASSEQTNLDYEYRIRKVLIEAISNDSLLCYNMSYLLNSMMSRCNDISCTSDIKPISGYESGFCYDDARLKGIRWINSIDTKHDSECHPTRDDILGRYIRIVLAQAKHISESEIFPIHYKEAGFYFTSSELETSQPNRTTSICASKHILTKPTKYQNRMPSTSGGSKENLESKNVESNPKEEYNSELDGIIQKSNELQSLMKNLNIRSDNSNQQRYKSKTAHTQETIEISNSILSSITPDSRFLLDTNCLLGGHSLIDEIIDIGGRVMIPVAVVKELNSLASNELGKSMVAKQALKSIEETLDATERLCLCTTKGNLFYSLEYALECFDLEVKEHDRSIIDTFIIETCRCVDLQFASKGPGCPRAVLVTDDRNMRIKANMHPDPRLLVVSSVQVRLYCQMQNSSY